MHKGTILLMQLECREEAREKTEAFLEEYKDRVWDWYQIGGRWTGTLDKYNPEDDPANIVKCDLCDGTGDRKDLSPPAHKESCGGCNGCHGKGKRVVWPTQFGDRDGDIMPLDKCLDVVKEWAQDPEEAGKAEVQTAEERYGKSGKIPNLNMYGHCLGKAGELYQQNFGFESNVFNTHAFDYSIPDDTTGWWAVIVDMHN